MSDTLSDPQTTGLAVTVTPNTPNTGDPSAGISGEDNAVSLEIEMSREDYQTLLDGAQEAGLSPWEFLMKAIAEGAFIARNRNKGNRVLIQTRRGLRELVD